MNLTQITVNDEEDFVIISKGRIFNSSGIAPIQLMLNGTHCDVCFLLTYMLSKHATLSNLFNEETKETAREMRDMFNQMEREKGKNG